MSLGRLDISNIRNIRSASLELDPTVNIFLGPNGSGKTSLLEAVYFLGSARTFRSVSVEPLISRGEPSCTVHGIVRDSAREVNLGVTRERAGGREIKRNGANVSKSSELARHLPTLVLGPNTVELLTGSPADRRKFLNWGVFHVEHSFAELWEHANRSLRQRNELLRRPGANARELAAWDAQLGQFGMRIDAQRRRWVEAFQVQFAATCDALTRLQDVTCTYQRGWDPKEELGELLNRQVQADLDRGYTQSGFHRAELQVRVGKSAATQVCSRGELKVLAWAMVLSQGRVFSELTGTDLVYLVDDLASELDDSHRSRVCESLASSHGQVLATGIEANQLKGYWPVQPKVFHVEHGSFSVEETVNEQR